MFRFKTFSLIVAILIFSATVPVAGNFPKTTKTTTTTMAEVKNPRTVNGIKVPRTLRIPEDFSKWSEGAQMMYLYVNGTQEIKNSVIDWHSSKKYDHEQLEKSNKVLGELVNGLLDGNAETMKAVSGLAKALMENSKLTRLQTQALFDLAGKNKQVFKSVWADEFFNITGGTNYIATDGGTVIDASVKVSDGTSSVFGFSYRNIAHCQDISATPEIIRRRPVHHHHQSFTVKNGHYSRSRKGRRK